MASGGTASRWQTPDEPPRVPAHRAGAREGL